MTIIPNVIMRATRQVSVIALACWALTSLPVSASMVPDAKPRKWPANPAKHQITVNRTTANETEKKMIALAEAAYPPKQDVAAAGRRSLDPDAKQLWSHKEVNGVKIPYAITGAAIEYYSAFVKDAGTREFTRYIEPSSKFTYEASVKSKDNFNVAGQSLPRVYVVKMKIEFAESFVSTGTEGIHFAKEREVVLAADGKVLKITGDGDVEVPVMAI